MEHYGTTIESKLDVQRYLYHNVGEDLIERFTGRGMHEDFVSGIGIAGETVKMLLDAVKKERPMSDQELEEVLQYRDLENYLLQNARELGESFSGNKRVEVMNTIIGKLDVYTKNYQVEENKSSLIMNLEKTRRMRGIPPK